MQQELQLQQHCQLPVASNLCFGGWWRTFTDSGAKTARRYSSAITSSTPGTRLVDTFLPPIPKR